MLFKIAVSGGLIYFFWSQDYFDFSQFKQIGTAPWQFLSAAVLVMLLVPLTSLRWFLLLRTRIQNIRFITLFQINYIGIFFNTALPGGLSGEVFKSIFIFRLAQSDRALAVMSVILDRICGLVGLLIVCVIGITLSWGKIVDDLLLLSVSTLVINVLVASVVGVILVQFVPKPLMFLVNKLPRKMVLVTRLLTRLIDALEHYNGRMGTILICILISVVIHVSAAGFLFFTAPFLGIAAYPVGDLLSALAIGNFANLMPLTPGGLGVGEAAYGQVLSVLRDPNNIGSFTVQYLMLRMVWVILSLPGGIIYIFYKREHPAVQSGSIRV